MTSARSSAPFWMAPLNAVQQFFFAKEVPYGLALARIMLPCVIMCDVLRRWPFARELYSMDGSPSPLADNFGFYNWLPEFSGMVAVALYTVFLLLLVTACIGWCTRFSLLALAPLYGYFGLLDCMSTVTKYSVISVHLLLLLGVSSCGSLWSVDAWLKRRSRPALSNVSDPHAELRCAVWPQRLIQLLFGIIYLGAALTKMHTPTFFSGDQLAYWMMTHINYEHSLGDYLAQFPIVLVVFGYVTIVWEVAFLFTVWRSWSRVPVLLIGAIFHIMTAFTLGLIVFPLVMFAGYLAFVTENDIREISRYWRRLVRGSQRLTQWRMAVLQWGIWKSMPPARLPRFASAAAFGCTLLLVAAAGVQAEYWMDPYQMRGAGGPLTLRELPDKEVERLLKDRMPIQEVDKIMAVDLGTISVGEHLLNRREDFHQGERVIVQVTLNPPHEDMLLECLLYDSESKLLSRLSQIAAREAFRSHFNYVLGCAVEPGDYYVIVRSKGTEVARKQLHLLPQLSAAAAN